MRVILVEKMTLSLKNIYKLLMNNDFPIYSESVIYARDRKGQTVLRFWQRIVIEEFRSMPYGKMIWRNDGKRNRYTSHLCNRSSELTCYEEYAKEIISQFHEQTLVNQVQNFEEFLKGKEYKYDVLIRRITHMMKLAKRDDEYLSNEIYEYVEKNISMPEELQKEGARGNLFHAAWILTILSLHAIAGQYMKLISWALLQEQYQEATIWRKFLSKKEHSIIEVEFLTRNADMIQCGALPKRSFFGREVELFDLQEMVLSGKKVLISGIGGIGKTELMRQLVVRCQEEQLVDQLATREKFWFASEMDTI